MFGTTVPLSKCLHCTTRQRQTGKKSLAVLKDLDSWILGFSCEKISQHEIKTCYVFHPYFAKAKLESREQLAALMCPHLCRQHRCLEEKKKKVWRKRQCEQNQAQTEQKHLFNESYIYCILEPSEHLLTRCSQFVSFVCFTFPGSTTLLRTSAT